MLGYQLANCLRVTHEVWTTLRNPIVFSNTNVLFDKAHTIFGVDATNLFDLLSVFRQIRPDVVINCVGIVKQHPDATDALKSLTINSLLPHRLSDLCELIGSRLIHISTDCVFSGAKGNYSEVDISDATDFYGRSKYLGEVVKPHCVTIRTSIVGRELHTKLGLVEWFLSRENSRIAGFEKAIYTGLTTKCLSAVIRDMILSRPEISGVLNISSDPISKFDLLCLMRDAFGWRGEIFASDEFVCDRSLDSTKFRKLTGYTPPSWDIMVSDLLSND